MTGDQPKATVLVVDDEASVRNILSQKLKEEGYACATASSGTAALRKLKVRQFDLALLDVRMPGKSGTEVLQEMRTRYPDMASVMVTAVAEVETAIDAMKMGAYDYIIKPVDLKALLVSVYRTLDKRRLVLENRNYQSHLEQKVNEQTERIRQSFLNSITSLAYALEAKDKYTSGHSQRVTEMAVAIAREMDMPEEKVEKIRLAGLLHDIGKIGVRESVLNKSAKLNDEEYHQIMSHSEIGERILSPVVEDPEIVKMVRHHHERYDGGGYPDGLSAQEIPEGARVLAVADAYINMSDDSSEKQELSQGARILAVADAYDAMTSDRPYRQAMSTQQARAELERGKNKQFDPSVVSAFLQIQENSNQLQAPADYGSNIHAVPPPADTSPVTRS